ncbi:hypothetical protein D3C77_735160 [compost metagenome]
MASAYPPAEPRRRKEHDQAVNRRRNCHGRVVQQGRGQGQCDGQRAIVNADLHADGNRLTLGDFQQTR